MRRTHISVVDCKDCVVCRLANSRSIENDEPPNVEKLVQAALWLGAGNDKFDLCRSHADEWHAFAKARGHTILHEGDRSSTR